MGFFYVIKRNLSMYQSFGFVLLTIAILGVLGYLVYQNRKTAFCKDAVLKGLVMAIVAFMPFAWFFVTQNHSEQHYMYTCKILAICAFGAVCTVGKMLQEPK